MRSQFESVAWVLPSGRVQLNRGLYRNYQSWKTIRQVSYTLYYSRNPRNYHVSCFMIKPYWGSRPGYHRLDLGRSYGFP